MRVRGGERESDVHIYAYCRESVRKEEITSSHIVEKKKQNE